MFISFVPIRSVGDTLWTGIYGGGMDDYAEHICQASDGGYIVTGYTWSGSVGSADLLIKKIDEDGNEVWSETCGGEDWDLGHAIEPTSDGGYVIAGYTQSFGAGANDLWLLKIAGGTSAIEDIVATPSIINLHENYPNPFNSSFVKIHIYDLLGRKVNTLLNARQSVGEYSVIWNADENSSGLYFYRIQTGNRRLIRKMTLLK
jgi:hypothetical protein